MDRKREKPPNGNSQTNHPAKEVRDASSPPRAGVPSIPPVRSAWRAVSGVPPAAVPSAQKKLRRGAPVDTSGSSTASPASRTPLSEKGVSSGQSSKPCYLLGLDTNLLLSLLSLLSPREQLQCVLPLCRTLYLSLSSLPFVRTLVLQHASAFASFFAPDRPLAMARKCCPSCCRICCFAVASHADDSRSPQTEDCGQTHSFRDSRGTDTRESARENCGTVDSQADPLDLPACRGQDSAASCSARSPTASGFPSAASVSKRSSSPASRGSVFIDVPVSSPLFLFFLHMRKYSQLEVVDVCIPGSVAPSPLLCLLLLRSAPTLRRLTVRGLDEGSISWRMSRAPLERAVCRPLQALSDAGAVSHSAPKTPVYWPCSCRRPAAESPEPGCAPPSNDEKDSAPIACGLEAADAAGADLPGGNTVDGATPGCCPPNGRSGATADSSWRQVSDALTPSFPCSVSADSASAPASSLLRLSSAGSPSPAAHADAPRVRPAVAAPPRRQPARGCGSCESVAVSAHLLASLQGDASRWQDLWFPTCPLSRLLADAVRLDTLELDVSRRRGMFATLPLAMVSLRADSLGNHALAHLRVLEVCNATPRSFKCGAISLPSLRSLRLHFAEVAADDAHDLGCLLQGCPQLESLAVHTDSDDDQMIFLNRLLIKSLRHLAGEDPNAGSARSARGAGHAAAGSEASGRASRRPQAASSAVPDGGPRGERALPSDDQQHRNSPSTERCQSALPRLQTFQMMLLDLRVITLLARVAPALRVLRLTEVESFRSREGRTVLMEAVRRLGHLHRLEFFGFRLEAEGKLELEALLAAEAEARGWGPAALTLGHGSSVAHEFFIPCM
ncbi:conserved hypothetical protein [Neospora caninum Liverpool]|uniref:F-box domain-containing protein n=1 Tax=Neospora caninum (strain Liverpool) TaxID=572307 RepID=F0V9N2_NEOCL|nr:conserved hypothetical protein [Neospora caninum Liverpool]CBZ50458.1 conserved hypothetical protein [Neospora caninum Liverpool]CEL65067.1 TPA: hypothetical protein BN1204_009270 [Neospora caninum Liverpool]|eukprot:XP_003880491.1 conserved hypothetical protein [Neospora caninum Liverpool]